MDIGEGVPVMITEEHVDSGLDEVHALLTKGGYPNQQSYALTRQPFEEATVWAAHEPVQLWKIVRLTASLACFLFAGSHSSPLISSTFTSSSLSCLASSSTSTSSTNI